MTEAQLQQLDDLLVKGRAAGWVFGEKDVHFTKRLGSGTSGVTYLGDVRGRAVAIKVYSSTILERDIVSVRNEILIGSTVKHPNVVEFVGVLVDPPTIALLTQFMPNGELGHALYNSTKALRSKGNDAKFQIAIGMAKGLQYLHENNVIHRDIKPENILLDENFNPCITDFGFSRHVDFSAKMTGQTGSYRYMAPEVVQNRNYTVKVDIFSFAVIVNEIFMGERPHQHFTGPDVALAVVRSNLRPSQGRIRNARLRTIIARAWDQDPAARPDWPEIIREIEASQLEMAVRRSAGIGALIGVHRPGSNPSTPRSHRLSMSDQSTPSIPQLAEPTKRKTT